MHIGYYYFDAKGRKYILGSMFNVPCSILVAQWHNGSRAQRHNGAILSRGFG
jgi:hypothetical protein